MKIAIVGAGISGLYLAWKLSEKGNAVEVFEKKEKIGKEVCSGLFSEKILNFIPQSEKLIENRISYVLIHFPKKTLKIVFSEEFLIMNHAQLDKAVAVLAEKAGAKIVLGKNINALPEGFDRIIGCDGPMSVIRNILDIKEPNFRIAMQGFIKNINNSDFVETWPIKNGFLWKIPRGKEVEYGVIGDSFDYCRRILEDFLKKSNIEIKKLKSALVPKEYCRFLIPQNTRVTICGDAAALIKPWSGGGVVWGLTAADILLEEFPDFLKYGLSAKKFFYHKILFSSFFTRIVYFLGFNAPWVFPKEIKLEGDFLKHAR